MKSLSCRPCSKKGYELLHQGTEALSIVEATGMRIDVPYLEKTIVSLDKQIGKLTLKLQSHKLWKRWKKEFGEKAKITAGEQLAHLLFTVMGNEVTKKTEGGLPSSDEAHLRTVDHPFVEVFVKLQKCIKVRSTYLEGIRRETMNGFLHPVFNLHIARTFRSSSDSPNFQNQPAEHNNKWMSMKVRRCFIPRKGRCLVELDYSGLEVRGAACYHKDPTMIRYITDPASDMHRDMAGQIYCIPNEEVSKSARYAAKNKFVFPQFYGDYYVNNAKGLWDYIDQVELKTASGIPIKECLARKHITQRGSCDPDSKTVKGTFEDHIRKVEEDFWGKRFRVYGQWKKDWWNKYRKTGGFEMLTGFRVDGIMGKNNVINYPVQGLSFHCLLWALSEMVLKELRRQKFQTVIIGQIHDSIVADVLVEELEDFIALARWVMTEKIKEWADWLNVPLEIEADIAPEGRSWYEKKSFEFTDNGCKAGDDEFASITEAFNHINGDQ